MILRRSLLGTVIGAMAVAAATVHAGGWAVITLDNLPDSLVVGKPAALAFVVRQHGMTPLGGLHPVVEAVLGNERVTAPALASQQSGHYTAMLTVPRAGDWVITIQSGFGQSRITLLPTSAVLPSAAGDTQVASKLSAAERGQRLFLAKGCVTCHQNTLGTANQSIGIAPALVPQKYQPDFLARILADPAGTLPPARGQVGTAMPNLNLQPQEIASLVAFINSARVTASR
jgi:mono/diheme cytochrome c family protein